MGMCVAFWNTVTQSYAELLLTQVGAGLTSFGTALRMLGALRRPHY